MEFSQSKMKQIIKNNSNKRVSKDAAQILGEDLEDKAAQITEKALQKLENKKRKTLRKQEIKEATT